MYRHGEPVVDLWGGLRDRGLPWRQDTLVPVFSVTKGMTATALAVAHARGLLDYDIPWPPPLAAEPIPSPVNLWLTCLPLFVGPA